MPDEVALNPIQSVQAGSNYYDNLPAPSSYQWGLEDLSDQDAGRTEDMTMHKKRVGQVVKLNLESKNLSTAEANLILRAFNPEYVDVRYIDPLFGSGDNFFKDRTFYVGNRSAPMRDAISGLWSNVSFNIIARVG